MKDKNLFKKGKNISFNLIEVIIIIIITGIFVSIGSGVIIYKNLYNTGGKSFTKSASLKEFEEVYNNILNSYVEKVDEKGLVEAAINAMFNYIGDDYSNYLDSEATSDLQDRLKGEYYGLGVEIVNTKDGNVVITDVFEDSPAFKNGLKIGDLIMTVNDETMTGKTSNYVSNLIKNSSQKKINLVYKRNNVETKIEVTLENVNIQSVTSNTFNNNIGYLKISTFSANTFIQFKSKLLELENKNIKSLIIDVRNNSGGYLDIANDIADLFIKDGKIIYELKRKDETVETYKAKDGNNRNYNIVVLINANSASASEILALALKESFDSKLVGKKSFGKGTVQEVENLSSGAMVKYTTAYWLSPKGNSINKIGITPDYEVSNTDKDEQVYKAIELLK